MNGASSEFMDKIVLISSSVEESEENEEGEIETVWAEKLKENEYQIRNVPFYYYDLAFLDIIQTERRSDGRLYPIKVLRRSGHSVFRIFLKKKSANSDFEKLWKELEKECCSYEGATESYIAIDVLPESDLERVARVLQKYEELGVLEYEVGYLHNSQ